LLSASPSDEVVEVFTGDTLELAMAHAVASLGTDLTVRSARRVRKGVQGLVGKDRYEVAAVPAPRASQDQVENAFEALLHRAEEAEEQTPTRVRRTTRPSPPVLAAVPETAPLQVVRDRPAAVRAAPASRRTATPAKRSAPARRPATPAAPTVWSRAALARLGLSKRVLAALPARDPRDDVGWTTALTKALSSVLPAPGAVGPTHPVVVDGHGLEGVLGMLAAAQRGMTPGSITSAGRTAPATAFELALVVREALR
jgi:hypothetical protein